MNRRWSRGWLLNRRCRNVDRAILIDDFPLYDRRTVVIRSWSSFVNHDRRGRWRRSEHGCDSTDRKGDGCGRSIAAMMIMMMVVRMPPRASFNGQRPHTESKQQYRNACHK